MRHLPSGRHPYLAVRTSSHRLLTTLLLVHKDGRFVLRQECHQPTSRYTPSEQRRTGYSASLNPNQTIWEMQFKRHANGRYAIKRSRTSTLSPQLGLLTPAMAYYTMYRKIPGTWTIFFVFFNFLIFMYLCYR